MLRFLLISAAALSLLPALRAQQTQNFPLDEKGESVMEVTHVFSSLPPGGYTAVRVSVKNAGKTSLPVTLSANSRTPAERDPHTLNSAGFSFDAKGESTTSREFIVPLMQDYSNSRGYGSDPFLQLNVSAGGRNSFSTQYSSSKEDGQPFVAFSQSIAGKSLKDLNEAMRNNMAGGSSGSGGYHRDGGFATSYLPSQLPSDWRGYTGLDALVMTPDEWLTLSPGVTTAIRQWVILGGTLDFFATGRPPESILQQLKTDRAEEGIQILGAGSVRLLSWAGSAQFSAVTDALLKSSAVSLVSWDGGLVPNSGTGGQSPETSSLLPPPKLPKSTTVIGSFSGDFSGILSKYLSSNPGIKVRHQLPRDEFRKSAGLANALEIRNFAAWQVGVILLIFGVLVGPVNLFYFAGAGRRHRLFFTTPLISLGASAVLIMVIMFQDGSGGSGSRAALIEIRPEDNSAYVRQFQVSRTGVLFGGGFVTEDLSLVTPLILSPSRWTRLKPFDFSGSEGQHLTAPDPLAYGGDWFQSRSEQAQLIETIRPGRGRLELKPGGGPPVIVSSLNCRLDQVFYTDAAGKVWTANAPLTTGGTATLREAVEHEFENFLRDQTKLFPMGAFDSSGNGKFIALSKDPQAGFASSLKSIKWQDDLAILHGPLTAHP